MKLLLMLPLFLSVITFRACDAPDAHDEMSLSLDPSYTEGTLNLIPYVTYSGDEEETFHFGQYIAWVEEIRYDDVVIYEDDGEQLDVDQQSTLNDDDEIEGLGIEIETEPGEYEIDAVAVFYVPNGEENEETHEEYRHERTQTVEVRSDDENDA
ncbi:hypothetical protein [Salisediminibacterium halotolerans]|uniref:hypothetical protein n=1 Tax=Salisediminibacterium halotolerans TaxID=517425 RepID=UPI000EB3C93E|nr:hypothetical protein [Salisediminibacterium halotolerans]RLJ73262.1 hypothetical protein BCL39_2018 [Actinophytocola xinjiangensis]RPE86684.1 hypothetical protein EDD67_2141 [Salisediminibacterium halotolerans]TWG34059.1 hypothetical protein BCL52_2015 [Salisediminibacterium halotolerans]GEL08906.1 hypothetical protein SHA02_23220 [Salisediminibacterium halotolerans]